jgi:hypothetical protein
MFFQIDMTWQSTCISRSLFSWFSFPADKCVELVSRFMKTILIAMEPCKGLALCEIADCGRGATVQIKQYFGLDEKETGRSERLCKEHFLSLQAEWAAIDVDRVRSPHSLIPLNPNAAH